MPGKCSEIAYNVVMKSVSSMWKRHHLQTSNDAELKPYRRSHFKNSSAVYWAHLMLIKTLFWRKWRKATACGKCHPCWPKALPLLRRKITHCAGASSACLTWLWRCKQKTCSIAVTQHKLCAWSTTRREWVCGIMQRTLEKALSAAQILNHHDSDFITVKFPLNSQHFL